MSRLGNLYKVGLLVTVPLMLQACGGGELTDEEIAALNTTTFEELKACSSNPKYDSFDSSCEGKTGVFMAAVDNGYRIKRDDCEGPDWVTAWHSGGTLLERVRSDFFDEKDALADMRRNSSQPPRCVKAVWRIDGVHGIRPLQVIWKESDEEYATRRDKAEAERLAREEVERVERAARELLAGADGFKYEREFLTLDEDGFERFTVPVSDQVVERARAMATIHVAVQQGKWSFDKDRYVPFSSLRDQFLTYAKFLNDKGGQRWPKKSSFETKDQYFARDDMPLEAFNNSVGSLFAEIHGDVKVCRDYYSASNQTLYLSPLKWNKLNGLTPHGDLSEPVKFSVKWTDKMSWGDNSEERSSLYFQPDGWFSIKASSDEAKRAFSSQECVVARVYGFVRSIRENGNTREARVIPTKIGFGDELYDVEEY